MGKTAVLLVLVVLVVSCFWQEAGAKPYFRLSRAFDRGLMFGALAGLGSGRSRGGGRTFIIPVGGGYGGGYGHMMRPMYG